MATDTRDPLITIDRATQELQDARSASDSLRIAQAAEKAWLSVVEATDDLLLRKHGITVAAGVTSHSERIEHLIATNHDDLAEKYTKFERTLHGDCFYFRRCYSTAILNLLFQQACHYVETATGKGGVCASLSARLHPEQKRLQ